MTVRVGTGWQTIIADLSMILFMLTASAVTHQKSNARAASTPASAPTSPVVQPAPRSAPIAVWIPGTGAPPLEQWLAQQPRDSRQQVTVTATYAPGAMDEALAQAQALARHAGDARVVVEPGPPGMRVVLSYDGPDAKLARGLRN